MITVQGSAIIAKDVRPTKIRGIRLKIPLRDGRHSDVLILFNGSDEYFKFCKAEGIKVHDGVVTMPYKTLVTILSGTR